MMRRRISSYASSDIGWSARGGSEASGGLDASFRQRRSFIEEGLLEGFRDNFEAEHMKYSEKINIKDVEESKVIIEKYRKKYLK